MPKVRQDAWSHEDDLLLAETVLRHIREGSTQLNAFEEVGDELNRTAAACGFRWNAEVRQNYEKAVDLAKRQRKQRKRAQHSQKPRVAKLVETTNEFDQQEQEPWESEPTPQLREETFSQPVERSPKVSIDSIIAQLKELKSSDQHLQRQTADYERLQQEIQLLRSNNEHLKKQLNQLKEENQAIKEDYDMFINIMERARKRVVFDEETSLSTPAFKMEKNGNLEKLAK
ncbi:RsfA family transcriptional regulator [Halalkalibacillus sediminis]|uniref:RsfA family transcriptional regulator n=1 Tax=Halalkalibacillus sediminis TaxID=2018042 RepID=A0A2I0QXM6_9BACI|nr:RsfA family transcriptional regulator [Halalkalibacillus sediminis]PKR79087.1 RsfA family transcriptional regulator [Halalkalibacillus sediminis]